MKSEKLSALFLCLIMFVSVLGGCATNTESQSYDDYVVNTAAESNEQAQDETLSEVGISKENINVGVLYISDPAEGSGYSYTHDLGIQGMQKNLGIADSQIPVSYTHLTLPTKA